MIPDFVKRGAARGTLPPGIHQATWKDFRAHFEVSPQRHRLFLGLERAVQELRGAGCRRIYLDGSFVTDKRIPNDYDGCWDAADVNPALLHPALACRGVNWREEQKRLYRGELWLLSLQGRAGVSILDFFQEDTRRPDKPFKKGIVLINL